MGGGSGTKENEGESLTLWLTSKLQGGPGHLHRPRPSHRECFIHSELGNYGIFEMKKSLFYKGETDSKINNYPSPQG